MKIRRPISKWLEIAEGLEYLSRKDDMPKVPAWRIAVLYSAVTQKLQAYHDQRNSLIKKLSGRDEAPWIVPAEKIGGFDAEMQPLLDEEFELEFETIKLEQIREITVRPAVFIACKDLFAE